MKFYLMFRDFFKIYKLPILSGVLFGCSFIPFPFFLLFFCLVPLWLFIYKQNSLKPVLIACFITQFIMALIGFNWIIYTFHFFGGINWLVSFVLLLLFCSIATSYITLSGWLWFVVTKKSSLNSAPAKLILLPLIFSVLHSLIPTLFPWNMGYTWFWGGLWGAQTAELWGFRFLNTLFYIFNLLFLIVYHHLHRFSSQSLNGSKIQNTARYITSFRLDKVGIKALSGAIFLFIFLNVLGFSLKKRLPVTSASLNVIIAQHNVTLKEKDFKPFRSFKEKSFYILRSLTYSSIKQLRKDKIKREDVDFILWPEGAYPYTIDKKRNREVRLSRFVRALKIPLITGAITQEADDYSNSIVVFSRKGRIKKPVYDKMKLLIFGEYIPLIDKWSFLKKIFPYFGSNFKAGTHTQVQELEAKKIGLQICYEALFDDLNRELANKSAHFLVNVTNDSWYGSWQEPYQHLTMSLARAIEIRRPIIRSTNTGFSGVSHADGTVELSMPLNKAQFHLHKVPYYKNPPKTLFMSWGYYINEIFLSLLLLLALVLTVRKN
ncbi:MAG: apolipoprotein N-acyltransferase [Bdellovibrionaceae bacterium]|nr:apolipoprotein N-acyltransferase [Pseudobdellovibrionaceae bacterium]